jgi:hypothetical protein
MKMQLTTVKELKQVQAGESLFLINPFGDGDQSRVKIKKIIVESVEFDRFVTLNVDSEWLDHDSLDHEFFTDLLSRGCKYVYTDFSEAESKLAEVRTGIHAQEVKNHHDSFEDYPFNWYNF